MIAVSENNAFVLPQGVGLASAGAAPVAAITAVAAYEALALAEGETVLVVGATGGVGTFFVQLAASAEATVIAPGLPEDHDYLLGLGEPELLDRNADLSATVREKHPEGVDAMSICVSQAPDASLLREGGRLASPIGAAGEEPGRFNVMAESIPAAIGRLAELLGAGTLRVPIQGSYPLEQAGEALQRPSGHPHRGQGLGATIGSRGRRGSRAGRPWSPAAGNVLRLGRCRKTPTARR